jgi:hypothetical protein
MILDDFGHSLCTWILGVPLAIFPYLRRHTAQLIATVVGVAVHNHLGVLGSLRLLGNEHTIQVDPPFGGFLSHGGSQVTMGFNFQYKVMNIEHQFSLDFLGPP